MAPGSPVADRRADSLCSSCGLVSPWTDQTRLLATLQRASTPISEVNADLISHFLRLEPAARRDLRTTATDGFLTRLLMFPGMNRSQQSAYPPLLLICREYSGGVDTATGIRVLRLEATELTRNCGSRRSFQSRKSLDSYPRSCRGCILCRTFKPTFSSRIDAETASAG